MNDSERIKSMTDSKIPLELAGLELLAQIRIRPHTFVAPRELKSSKGVLLSDNFSRCQGISFVEPNGRVGALAHNFSLHDPYNTLTGAWTGGDYDLEDPKKIFGNLGEVVAVHMYHKERHDWPEVWVGRALKSIGVGKVIHIPIRSKGSEEINPRSMVHDVEKGAVHIFSQDHGFGITYRPFSS